MHAPDPVLLTGASGYVGSHLLPVLLERGREVRALARRPETEMVVKTPPPPGLNDHPLDFEAAVRAALQGRA